MRFLLIAMLAGCAAQTQWVHPTKNEQQGYEDSFQCQQMAVAANPKTVDPLDDSRERYWRSCMMAKGWREQ